MYNKMCVCVLNRDKDSSDVVFRQFVSFFPSLDQYISHHSVSLSNFINQWVKMQFGLLYKHCACTLIISIIIYGLRKYLLNNFLTNNIE